MNPLIRTWESPTTGELGETAEEFLRRLGSPCWIRISGRDRSRVRAITTLLHGNEPSGTRALHRFLRSGLRPETDLLALVANVEAALAPPGFAYRTLPGRRDLNRCFTRPDDKYEGRLAREILDGLSAARPEALIDLHNTSGSGPAYGVGLRADHACLSLASLFTRHFVLTGIRLGALMEAITAEFPALTIECGGAQDPNSDTVAFAGFKKYACSPAILGENGGKPDVTVIEHPLRIRLTDSATVAYSDAPVAGRSLTLRADIDKFNSTALSPEEPLGWIDRLAVLTASGHNGGEMRDELFDIRAGRLYSRMPLRLFMATTDTRIAVADCLFYAVPL